MTRPLLLAAGWLVASPDVVIRGGGVLVRRGRVARIVVGPRALARAAREARRVDLGELVLSAGLIDAHAHLELGGYRGLLPRGSELSSWIAALLALRRAAPADEPDGSGAGDAVGAAGAARLGARELLASGTTAVGDVSAQPAWWRAAGRLRGPRIVLQRELLDAFDPGRTAGALHSVARALPRRTLVGEALSPHAAYTASDELLSAAGRLARRRGLALAVHWNETREERDWVERGRGPFAALCLRSPRAPSLERLEAAGLLGPRTALVHGNDSTAKERERIAARGATLVHCPGCHAFFARAPFGLRAYLRAGVRVALGTDSLASNDALDMRRELGLLCAAQPWIEPATAWGLATVNGARALGLAHPSGTLLPGAALDAVAWSAPGSSGSSAALIGSGEPLGLLCRGALRPALVFVAGKVAVDARPPRP